MMIVVEYALFGVLMALNLGLGLYFSLPGKWRSGNTPVEMFLGNRALRALPLAASVVASLISSTGLVGLTGHFYAYGFHFTWVCLSLAAAAPIASWLFLPVLYELRVTSVFEYLRLRFNSVISITTCVIYVLLTQSIGALTIYAASLTIVTVFGAPLMWCNIGIGLCGTLYTALGGLRAVVWTDCMQLVFILIGPATIIAKIIFDWNSPGASPQPLSDIDLRAYFANLKFDITHDENVWSAVSSITVALYRVGMDQVVVQRCMASRTLASARRTTYIGALLLNVFNLVLLAMAFALVLWFRGCDPLLASAVRSYDQILPFYIKTYLVTFPGFTGLFLAAVVTAATSTISSAINTMAAVLYVDILSLRIKCLNIGHVTRGLAFLLGIVMTLYSCICLYLGSVVGAIIMVNAATTGPCVGLLLLAVAFPFVHSKGAGISTLLMFGLQLCLMWLRIRDGLRSPHMPLSLEYCHENTSYLQRFPNVTSLNSSKRVQHDGGFIHFSPFWNCLLSTCGTVVLGVVISLATGELKKPRASVKHLSRPLVGLWRRLRVMEAKETDQVTLAQKQCIICNICSLERRCYEQPRKNLCESLQLVACLDIAFQGLFGAIRVSITQQVFIVEESGAESDRHSGIVFACWLRPSRKQ